MVGGAAVLHASSYLFGYTKIFGTAIGLMIVLVGLLGLAGKKRTNVQIATLTGIILSILLTNALVVEVVVALYPIIQFLKDDKDAEVQLWRQASSPHMLRCVQKALDVALQMITNIDEHQRHETIMDPDSYYDQALALNTYINELPAMLGDTSNVGKQPAAVRNALDQLFGDDAEDGAEVIRLIGMELPNMKAALGRLRDADKTYDELDMSDVDSVKAAWRAKYESTSLPDPSNLPRFSTLLRHLSKHCLYEKRGRKLLKMTRWALLGVQVPAAWMSLNMLLRQTARQRDKDW
ncbi:hypothetical protein COCOBI_16-2250 [Coccomyxa sp. Obi]|nr:hypothetical protein COCOBI_16-2250 [Coccomyxa sp. Obi]